MPQSHVKESSLYGCFYPYMDYSTHLVSHEGITSRVVYSAVWSMPPGSKVHAAIIDKKYTRMLPGPFMIFIWALGMRLLSLLTAFVWVLQAYYFDALTVLCGLLINIHYFTSKLKTFLNACGSRYPTHVSAYVCDLHSSIHYCSSLCWMNVVCVCMSVGWMI